MTSYFIKTVATLRWLSALIAVSYHVRFLLFCSYAQSRHTSVLVDLFFFLTSFGHEAFAVYMVLSGLLLGGLSPRSSAHRTADPWPALRRHLLKLYFVLLSALAVGGVLDAVGIRAFAGSGIYEAVPWFTPAHLGLAALAGNLLALQGIASPCFGSNAMLFLIAFECWACVVYGLVVLPGPGRRLAGLLASCAAVLAITALAPEFPAYLGAWLVGFAVARMRGHGPAPVSAWLGAIFFAVAVFGSRYFDTRLGAMGPGLLIATRTLLDLVLALGLGSLLLALHGAGSRGTRLGKLKRGLVELSLPLNTVHLPCVIFVAAAAHAWLGLPLHAQPSVTGVAAFGLVVGAGYAGAMLVAVLASMLGAAVRRRRRVLAARYSAS